VKNLVDLSAAAVGVASRIRGERVIHAKGRAYAATVRVLPAAGWLAIPLASAPTELTAQLRLSRAVGLPDALPDVLGFALRIEDADGQGGIQDLLLASSAAAPMARHLLTPARDPLRTSYSSITPSQVGEARLLVGAFPRNVRERPEGSWFDLATAPVRGGWTTFAEVQVGEQLSSDASTALSFDVAHDAGGFRADRVFRRLRAIAYPVARAPES
jgi:hypothetical protein